MRPRPASRVPLALAALPCAAKPMSIDYPARGGLTIRMDRRLPSPSGVAGKHPRKDGCGSPAISASATAGALVLMDEATGLDYAPVRVASCDRTGGSVLRPLLSLGRFEMTEARGTPVGDIEAALLALHAGRERGAAVEAASIDDHDKRLYE
jgi:hypothetical protein